MYKVLCVSYEKSKIGAACYDESEHAIEYLRDTTDNAEFDTLKYCKLLSPFFQSVLIV